jgi:putative ABC transport system permease protein
MRLFRRFFNRLANLFSKRNDNRRLQEEIEEHIALQTEENRHAGMTAVEARRQARLKFGAIGAVSEQYHAEQTLPFAENLFRDLRYALRQWKKSPGFTLVAIVTLALGMGATTAIFSLIHSALRLPFPHAEHMVAIKNTYPAGMATVVSYPDFEDWKNRNTSFEHMAALFASRMTYAGTHEPVRVNVSSISSGFFSLFGLNPVAGRNFSPAEQTKGAAPVCVLDAAFATQEFGTPASAVGRSLVLNNKAYSVVGVMPPMTPSIQRRAQVWLPLEAAPFIESHGNNYLFATGVLRPGVSLTQAQSDLAVVQSQIDRQFPANKHGIQLVSLSDALFGSVRPVMLALFAAVGFILLIACVNLANMLLARSTERMREFGIRQALGAGPWRLVRQSLVESALLAAAGGVAGLALAYGVTRIPVQAWPKFLEAPSEVHLGGAILLFSTALVVLTSLLFGLAPAIQILRHSAKVALQSDARTMSGGREQRLVRAGLMAAELAFATLLVGGALHMVTYFVGLLRTDPGVRTDHLLSLSYSLPPQRYPQDAEQRLFYSQLQQKLAALPGIESAGATGDAPFAGSQSSGDFLYEGGPTSRHDHQMFTDVFFITSGYLDTMQAHLLQGRFFSAQDTLTSPKVALINQSLAARLWPNQNPVGKHIQIIDNDWRQIVGVVADVRAAGAAQPAGLQVYLSTSQFDGGLSDLSVVLRTRTDPMDFADAARQAVHSIDPNLPISNLTPVQALAAQSVAGQSTAAALMSALGLLALLLASVGVYGVVSYAVSRRQQEFGIRLALGAQRNQIFALLLRSTTWIAVPGITVGLLLAWPLNQWMRALLGKSQQLHPATLISTTLLLATVALLATLLPARRAAQADPMRAIRSE